MRSGLTPIARATEMRVGLDSKRGLPKLFHAREYRKYAQETYRITRVFVISQIATKDD